MNFIPSLRFSSVRTDKLRKICVIESDYIGLLSSCLPEEQDEENHEIYYLTDHAGFVWLLLLFLIQHCLVVDVAIVEDTGVGVQN